MHPTTKPLLITTMLLSLLLTAPHSAADEPAQADPPPSAGQQTQAGATGARDEPDAPNAPDTAAGPRTETQSEPRPEIRPDTAPKADPDAAGQAQAEAQTQPQTQPQAQQPQAEPPRTDREADGAGQQARDPFGTTPAMQEQARQQRPPGTDGRGLIQAPQVTLRGYIRAADKDKQPLALLEVQGAGVTLVRAGDTLSVRHKGVAMTLKVTAVLDMAAQIEIEPLNERLIVR